MITICPTVTMVKIISFYENIIEVQTLSVSPRPRSETLGTSLLSVSVLVSEY